MIPEPLINAIDNQNSLANLANSILLAFGAETFHNDIKEVTAILKNRKRVCAVLFDGMGKALLKETAKGRKAMENHTLAHIQSVNPATTAAATISFLTGRFPRETGWLGWSIDLPEYGGPVDVFPNRLSKDGTYLGEKSIMREVAPLVTLDQLLAKAGVRTRLAFPDPIENGSYTDLKEMGKTLDEFYEGGDGFLYLYYEQPDSSAHHYGPKDRRVKRQIDKALSFVEKAAGKHPDVLFLVLADHGLLEVGYRDIAAYPALHGLLRRPLSLEGRTRALYVQEGKKEEFAKLFEDYFGDAFYLVDSRELFDRGYFGEGEPHPRALSFLGDYIAIAKGHDLLIDSTFGPDLRVIKGHHAGNSKEEKEICLLAYNR